MQNFYIPRQAIVRVLLEKIKRFGRS